MTPKYRASRFDMIANQMIKGCNGPTMQYNVAAHREQIEVFKKLYYNTIKYIEDTVPKTMSVGVCGALGKAILWYGKDKMSPFVEAVSHRDFKGRLDPVHVLWEWLIRFTKRNPNEIYRKTVTAVRLFIRNAENEYLKPAKDDIFEWKDNFTIMYKPKRNQWSKTCNSEVKSALDEE